MNKPEGKKGFTVTASETEDRSIDLSIKFTDGLTVEDSFTMIGACMKGLHEAASRIASAKGIDKKTFNQMLGFGD